MKKRFAGGIPFKRINDEFDKIVMPEVSSVILEGEHERLSTVQIGHQIKKGIPVFCETEEFSAICAGISGTVERVERGNDTAKVTIKASEDFFGQTSLDPIDKTLSELTPDEISLLLRKAGVPVPKVKKDAKFLTVDCGGSPYDMSRLYLCVKYPNEVIGGARILMKLLNAKKCYFAIPSSCLKAAQSIEDHIASRKPIIKISLYKEKYPSIPQLTVGAIYGVEISAYRNPEDVGYPVITPHLCYWTYQALANGVPFGSDFISFTDENDVTSVYLVPIGARLYEVFDVPIGYKLVRAEKVFGAELDEDERMKSGIFALTIVKDEPYPIEREKSCIGCQRCINVCPSGIIPNQLYQATENKALTPHLKNELLSCFACGCCSAVCPVGLPLYEIISNARNEYLSSPSDEPSDTVGDEVVELTQVPLDADDDASIEKTVGKADGQIGENTDLKGIFGEGEGGK